jgi:predicted Zn-ribbon and HTH transcriptional regulator
MANETKLTWAKAHSYWLDKTDLLYSSVTARYLFQVLNILARESSAGGEILIGDKPATVKDISHRVNLPPEETTSALKELEAIDLVSLENETILLVDYVRDQVLSGDDLSMSKTRDYGRMRTRKHEGKETNRDRVVKIKAKDVIRSLGGTGLLNPNTITQILNITNTKSSKNAVTEIRKILEDDKENDQDFLSVCYDLGYIPFDDSSAYDQVWEMLKNQKPEFQKTSDTLPATTKASEFEKETKAETPTQNKRFRGWDESNEIQNTFVTLHSKDIREIILQHPEYISKIFGSDNDEISKFFERWDVNEWIYSLLEKNGWKLKMDDEALKAMIEVGNETLKALGSFNAKPFKVDDFEKLNKKYFGNTLDKNNYIPYQFYDDEIPPEPEEPESEEYPF